MTTGSDRADPMSGCVEERVNEQAGRGPGRKRVRMAPSGGDGARARLRKGWLDSAPPALFENSPVGMACLDPGGVIVQCNEAFARVLGCAAEALMGQPFPALIAAEDRGDVRVLLASLVTHTARRGSLENLRLAVDGRAERTAAVAVSSLERQGEVVGVLVHLTETTGQHAPETESRHAHKLQVLGQLTGGVVHDFNTLIAAILGGCELLLGRHGPDDPSHDDLEQMRATALRARALVGQLLSFVRRQPLQPERLRVDTAIDGLAPLLRRLLGAAIVVETRHEAAPLPTVRMDPGQFDQAILNLAVNARDAMPDGGWLCLGTSVEVLQSPVQHGQLCLLPGPYVVVTVADSGCGIPEDIVDHIFQPFFTTKREGAGTGLGLATVSDIVRDSGGSVVVHSAPGEGSTFRILIPAQADAGEAPTLAAVEAAVAEPPVAPQMPEEPGTARILLVDDEEIVRRFAARALRSRGYDVLEAADGETALDALSPAAPKVDLLLADLVLPGADGRAVIEHALTIRPEMRAIVISAHLPDEGWRSGAGAGRIHLLPKPFTLAELAAAVKRALGR